MWESKLRHYAASGLTCVLPVVTTTTTTATTTTPLAVHTVEFSLSASVLSVVMRTSAESFPATVSKQLGVLNHARSTSRVISGRVLRRRPIKSG